MIPSIEQLQDGRKCYCYDSLGIRTIAEVLSYTFSLDSAYKVQKQELEVKNKELKVKDEQNQNLQKQVDLSNQQVSDEQKKSDILSKELKVEENKLKKQKVKSTFVEVIEGLVIILILFIAVK